MKIKLSQYIADFLAGKGVKHVFTVTGGGAMHLNDSFGHHDKLECIYNHHEQASAIAAESYARINNEIAVVCVTSGPGGINALNGVAGGWLDSIPMLIISGQTKYALTVQYSGLNLRCMGNQEFNIIKTVENMTKYCEMIIDKNKIKYCLEKALYLAQTGRPGPCWLDIPLDIQGATIDTDDLIGFDIGSLDHKLSNDDNNVLYDEILKRINEAQRPVLYAGNGIRIAGAYDLFRKLVEKLGIPVVTAWNSIDTIPTGHLLYVGRAGTMGDRAGNFAVQNSDLVISLGCRLNIYQVGYNVKTWAREAYTIVVDIDEEELKKTTVRIDKPVCMDVKVFINRLLLTMGEGYADKKDGWISKCQKWKINYPVVMKKHYENTELVNVYAFINELSKRLHENDITVVANGSASVVGSQAFIIKEDQRFIMNCELSSMGYDLPAAIGACVACGKKRVICIAGDGSIQMNLQELQTIITNKLPIIIFVINNGGYHQIRLTQTNIFHNKLVGVGLDSGDLEFPSFSKLADVYGYRYFSCQHNSDLEGIVTKVLDEPSMAICEVFVTTDQIFEPKSATKKKDDGTLVSPPLEDLAPFLPRDEFLSNMVIKPIDFE